MIQENNRFNKIVGICLYLYAAFIFMFNADSSKNVLIYLVYAVLVGLLGLAALKKGVLNICEELVLLVGYLAFGFFSIIWAVNTDAAVTAARTLLILIVALLLIYDWVTQTKRADILLRVIIFAGLCEAVYFLLTYGVQEVIDAINDGLRIGSQLDNQNAIGKNMAISLTALFGYALCFRKYKHLLLAIPMLVVLIATGSRTSLISMFFGMAVVACVLLSRLQNKKLSRRLPAVVLVVVGIVVAWNAMKTMPFLQGIVQRFEGLENTITGEIGGDDSAAIRLDYVRLGLQQFLDTPLFGNGLGCAGQILKEKYGYVTYLHNNFAEILASGGLVGFLLYYGMYAVILFKHIKLLKTKNPVVTASLGILCCELVSHIGSVNYYSKIAYLLFALWVSVGNGHFLGVEGENKNEEGLAGSQ